MMSAKVERNKNVSGITEILAAVWIQSVFLSSVNFLQVANTQRHDFSYLAPQSVIGVWKQKLQLGEPGQTRLGLGFQCAK